MSGTILVVGAAGGVGTEVVRRLLADGNRVIGTVLNDREGDMVRRYNAGVARVIEMDCGDAGSVRRILDENLSGEERLDSVVVCAAISPYGPVETQPLEVVRRAFEINATSGIAVYQAAMRHLRQSRGRIVYISSMAGRFGMPFIGFYTASKFALEGAVEVMRTEAAAWGVELVLVEPGGIRTSMMSSQIEELQEGIEQLSAEERELYGENYRQFLALSSSSYESALEPGRVADVVLRALRARKPRVRYKVGKDSKALCLLAWLLPRRWFESLVRKVFANALKTA